MSQPQNEPAPPREGAASKKKKPAAPKPAKQSQPPVNIAQSEKLSRLVAENAPFMPDLGRFPLSEKIILSSDPSVLPLVVFVPSSGGDWGVLSDENLPLMEDVPAHTLLRFILSSLSHLGEFGTKTEISKEVASRYPPHQIDTDAEGKIILKSGEFYCPYLERLVPKVDVVVEPVLSRNSIPKDIKEAYDAFFDRHPEYIDSDKVRLRKELPAIPDYFYHAQKTSRSIDASSLFSGILGFKFTFLVRDQLLRWEDLFSKEATTNRLALIKYNEEMALALSDPNYRRLYKSSQTTGVPMPAGPLSKHASGLGASKDIPEEPRLNSKQRSSVSITDSLSLVQLIVQYRHSLLRAVSEQQTDGFITDFERMGNDVAVNRYRAWQSDRQEAMIRTVSFPVEHGGVGVQDFVKLYPTVPGFLRRILANMHAFVLHGVIGICTTAPVGDPVPLLYVPAWPANSWVIPLQRIGATEVTVPPHRISANMAALRGCDNTYDFYLNIRTITVAEELMLLAPNDQAADKDTFVAIAKEKNHLVLRSHKQILAAYPGPSPEWDVARRERASLYRNVMHSLLAKSKEGPSTPSTSIIRYLDRLPKHNHMSVNVLYKGFDAMANVLGNLYTDMAFTGQVFPYLVPIAITQDIVFLSALLNAIHEGSFNLVVCSAAGKGKSWALDFAWMAAVPKTYQKMTNFSEQFSTSNIGQGEKEQFFAVQVYGELGDELIGMASKDGKRAGVSNEAAIKQILWNEEVSRGRAVKNTQEIYVAKTTTRCSGHAYIGNCNAFFDAELISKNPIQSRYHIIVLLLEASVLSQSAGGPSRDGFKNLDPRRGQDAQTVSEEVGRIYERLQFQHATVGLGHMLKKMNLLPRIDRELPMIVYNRIRGVFHIPDVNRDVVRYLRYYETLVTMRASAAVYSDPSTGLYLPTAVAGGGKVLITDAFNFNSALFMGPYMGPSFVAAAYAALQIYGYNKFQMVVMGKQLAHGLRFDLSNFRSLMRWGDQSRCLGILQNADFLPLMLRAICIAASLVVPDSSSRAADLLVWATKEFTDACLPIPFRTGATSADKEWMREYIQDCDAQRLNLDKYEHVCKYPGKYLPVAFAEEAVFKLRERAPAPPPTSEVNERITQFDHPPATASTSRFTRAAPVPPPVVKCSSTDLTVMVLKVLCKYPQVLVHLRNNDVSNLREVDEKFVKDYRALKHHGPAPGSLIAELQADPVRLRQFLSACEDVIPRHLRLDVTQLEAILSPDLENLVFATNADSYTRYALTPEMRQKLREDDKLKLPLPAELEMPHAPRLRSFAEALRGKIIQENGCIFPMQIKQNAEENGEVVDPNYLEFFLPDRSVKDLQKAVWYLFGIGHDATKGPQSSGYHFFTTLYQQTQMPLPRLPCMPLTELPKTAEDLARIYAASDVLLDAPRVLQKIAFIEQAVPRNDPAVPRNDPAAQRTDFSDAKSCWSLMVSVHYLLQCPTGFVNRFCNAMCSPRTHTRIFPSGMVGPDNTMMPIITRLVASEATDPQKPQVRSKKMEAIPQLRSTTRPTHPAGESFDGFVSQENVRRTNWADGQAVPPPPPQQQEAVEEQGDEEETLYLKFLAANGYPKTFYRKPKEYQEDIVAMHEKTGNPVYSFFDFNSTYARETD